MVPLWPVARRGAALHLLGSVLALAFCAVFLYAAVPWWHETWETGQTTSTDLARAPVDPLSLGAGRTGSAVPAIRSPRCYMVATQRELPFGLGAEDRL